MISLLFNTTLDSKDSLKAPYSWFQFCSKKNIHRQGLEGSWMQSFHAFPCEVKVCHPSSTSLGSPGRKLFWASLSWVFIGLVLLRHAWLNHWPGDWALSPPQKSEKGGAQSFRLWSHDWSFWWPDPILKTFRARHLTSIMKTLLLLRRKFQRLLKLCGRNHG